MNIEIHNLRNFPQFVKEIEYETSREFQEFPAAKPIETLIALVDGKFAGAGSISEGDLTYGPHSDKNPWIADFFVKEPYRRHGVGMVLLRSLLDLGLRQYPEIYIWTKDLGLANVLSKYTEYLGTREYFGFTIYIFKESLSFFEDI